MARDGGQQHKAKGRSAQDEETVDQTDTDAVAERKEKLDDDVDAILDDIDEVLESNAEEFVRGFVQKGGQ